MACSCVYRDVDTDSAISEDEMEMDPIAVVRASASKAKVSEVESSSMSQEIVEVSISKDIEHISSIFGVPVCPHTILRVDNADLMQHNL